MAWSTENWIQDDTKLSGYPAPVGTAYPEEFSLGGLTSIWLFNHQFNGYPHPAEFPPENPYFMYIGTRPVEELYIGNNLIWKSGGINKINIPELS